MWGQTAGKVIHLIYIYKNGEIIKKLLKHYKHILLRQVCWSCMQEMFCHVSDVNVCTCMCVDIGYIGVCRDNKW